VFVLLLDIPLLFHSLCVIMTAVLPIHLLFSSSHSTPLTHMPFMTSNRFSYSKEITSNKVITNTAANSTTSFANDTSSSYTPSIILPLKRFSIPVGACQNATYPQTRVFFSMPQAPSSHSDWISPRMTPSFRTVRSSVILATVAGLNISGLNTDPVKITLAVTVTLSLYKT
jgi:hypothetical protein